MLTLVASIHLALGLSFAPPEAAAFQRVDAVDLADGENFLASAVIDPADAFAYVGTFTSPGQVIKIDLATFERVDAITLESGENSLISAVIDHAGDFAYFGTNTNPGQLVKIDLETFQRVDAITLEIGEQAAASPVIDPAGVFAYFGTTNFPGKVVKIDLESFERVDVVTLANGEDSLTSAVIDPAGTFAYFGTSTSPGRVVKIDLVVFERVDSITLASGEDEPGSVMIDPAGAFAYFGTDTFPGRLVKIDLAKFERTDAIPLADGEDRIRSAVIGPAGAFAYLGTYTFPGRVVRLELATFERVDAITLPAGDVWLRAAVIDSEGTFAYFGADSNPGRVVKILLSDLSPQALAVDTESLASDGNGVFEPGEQVEAAPAWRNNDSAPLSLSGTASAFAGPAGAVYDLVLSNADYGIVAPDAAASCRDTGVCYSIEVDDPIVRPAPHWDATFEETLDDSGATAKTWTLHLGDSFTDVARSSSFYRFIETLVHGGVTSGCSGSSYCPAATVKRGQMAVFALKALNGYAYEPPACTAGSEVFGDVPSTTPFCPWIEELAGRGVVAGCGGGNYCPGNSVTRAQMAIFLLKTSEGSGYEPPSCVGLFTDVACPSTFASWIEELYNRGITGGCRSNPLAYCPGSPVTRGQMSVFLTRTFALDLYAP